MIPETMKALVINGITPADKVKLDEVRVPEAKPGWVLVRVCGFGLNHSEQVLRLGEVEADYIAKPIVPGIECVGKVVDTSGSGFMVGQRVCALMGGMGRSFDGSYAEYALVPAHHVFRLPESVASMTWEKLAAIPETFYTAWGSLVQCLRLRPEDTLLVRGGTCGLGYAALQIAHALGCRTVATARSEGRLGRLTELGCDLPVVDGGHLADSNLGATKVLELVGTSTLRDSLRCMPSGGIVCHTGILGGEKPLKDFNPLVEIPNGVSLTGFHSNWPNQESITTLFEFIVQREIKPVIAKVFSFEHLPEAVALQDAGGFDGKIVIVNEEG